MDNLVCHLTRIFNHIKNSGHFIFSRYLNLLLLIRFSLSRRHHNLRSFFKVFQAFFGKCYHIANCGWQPICSNRFLDVIDPTRYFLGEIEQC